MTIITGEKSTCGNDGDILGNCNGVGKTTALRLVNYCLAATNAPEIKKIPRDWNFYLEFELNGQKQLIERSADGKILALDQKEIKLKKLQEYFNLNGPFNIDKNIPCFSFRAFITRFIRNRHGDMSPNTISLSRENHSESILKSLYLLGGSYQLAYRKMQNKIELDALNSIQKGYKEEERLAKISGKGADSQPTLAWLKDQVKTLTYQLDNMKIFEAFDDIQQEIAEIEKLINDIDKKISVCNFQLHNIDKSLSYTPDITKDELLSFYKGLEAIFTKEALIHFDLVEKFHSQMAINRKIRLENDKIELKKQIKDNSLLRSNFVHKAIMLESQLKNRHSSKEYLEIAQKKAKYEADIARLEDVRSNIDKIQEKKALINKAMADDLLEATKYVQSQPLEQQSERFRQIFAYFSSTSPSGISLEINEGKGQVQFDLNISAESNMSDGITQEKILAFDWLLLTHGVNHHLDFLWHDNALFAHIDAGHRSSWLEHIYEESIDSGKQYIMSINKENFDESLSYLCDKTAENLKNRIVLKLSGDKDENKLLGLYFDDK